MDAERRAVWRRRVIVATNIAVSLGLLVVVFRLSGAGAFAQLRNISATTVLACMAITLVQVVLSAWRWRFTARRLGLDLPLAQAVREYYLSTALNQILPGGVLGDANRAWRHGEGESVARAARAVVLERASGQMALALAAAAALASWPRLAEALERPLLAAAALLAAVIAVGAVAFRWSVRRGSRAAPKLAAEVHRALLARSAWPVQLAVSLLVIGSYVAIYVLAARTTGAREPLTQLIPLMLLALVAMSVPISVSGWGVREGAAALAWRAAGLDPGAGVSASVIYGVLTLISAAPGLLILLWPRGKQMPEVTD